MKFLKQDPCYQPLTLNRLDPHHSIKLPLCAIRLYISDRKWRSNESTLLVVTNAKTEMWLAVWESCVCENFRRIRLDKRLHPKTTRRKKSGKCAQIKIQSNNYACSIFLRKKTGCSLFKMVSIFELVAILLRTWGGGMGTIRGNSRRCGNHVR